MGLKRRRKLQNPMFKSQKTFKDKTPNRAGLLKSSALLIFLWPLGFGIWNFSV
jgi:hypothetical protein